MSDARNSPQRNSSACLCTFAAISSCLGFMLLTSSPAIARAQSPTQGPDPTYSSPNASTTSHEGLNDGLGRVDPVEASRRRQAQRAAIRQDIAADSTRLLQLAQELNDEIKQQHPEALTQAELKKYADIGKLAHKLKAEMKDFGTAGIQIQPLPGIVPAPDPRGRPQQ